MTTVFGGVHDTEHVHSRKPADMEHEVQGGTGAEAGMVQTLMVGMV